MSFSLSRYLLLILLSNCGFHCFQWNLSIITMFVYLHCAATTIKRKEYCRFFKLLSCNSLETINNLQKLQKQNFRRNNLVFSPSIYAIVLYNKRKGTYLVCVDNFLHCDVDNWLGQHCYIAVLVNAKMSFSILDLGCCPEEIPLERKPICKAEKFTN